MTKSSPPKEQKPLQPTDQTNPARRILPLLKKSPKSTPLKENPNNLSLKKIPNNPLFKKNLNNTSLKNNPNNSPSNKKLFHISSNQSLSHIVSTLPITLFPFSLSTRTVPSLADTIGGQSSVNPISRLKKSVQNQICWK